MGQRGSREAEAAAKARRAMEQGGEGGDGGEDAGPGGDEARRVVAILEGTQEKIRDVLRRLEKEQEKEMENKDKEGEDGEKKKKKKGKKKDEGGGGQSLAVWGLMEREDELEMFRLSRCGIRSPPIVKEKEKDKGKEKEKGKGKGKKEAVKEKETKDEGKSNNRWAEAEEAGKLLVRFFEAEVERDGGSKLANVDLSHNRLARFPFPEQGMARLTHLDLRFNHLHGEWAPQLASLSHLQVLKLARNGIHVIPDSIGELSELVYLDLHNNPVAKIPEELCKLAQLTHLDISESLLIAALPESIGSLSSLQTLKANHNNITKLPPSFSDLTSLSHLDLNTNPLIADDPDAPNLKVLSKFFDKVGDSLRYLDIGGTFMSHFPKKKHWAMLQSLEWLNTSPTKVAKFPDGVCELASLQHLTFGASPATEVPESISRLTALRTLEIRWNKISVFPVSVLNLPHLTSLDLCANALTEVPEDITRLTGLRLLNLSDNKLGSLTKDISKLESLAALNLEGNPIMTQSKDEKGKKKKKKQKGIRFITRLTNNPKPTLPLVGLDGNLPSGSKYYRDPKTRRIRDRIYGCLFGHTIGDAIGLATEFLSKEQASFAYGIAPYKYENFLRDRHRTRWERGDFTDDTDQMILIMENLLANEGQIDIKAFALSLLQWAHQGFAELGDEGGMGLGATIRTVLRHKLFLDDPHAAAEAVWLDQKKNAAANGAVMRTSVLGVWNFDDLEAVVRNTVAIAQVTHRDSRCVASCIAVTVAIALILQNADKEDVDYDEIAQRAFEEAEKILETEELKKEFRQHVEAPDFHALKLGDRSAIGYTLKCVGAGFVALRYDSFESAICRMTREAGDADTNGAVCGALLGAKLGLSGIPAEWLNELLQHEWFGAKVERLCQMLGV